MYGEVVAAEKLSSFARAELIKDVERRRIAAVRRRQSWRWARPEPPSARKEPTVVPLFAIMRALRPS